MTRYRTENGEISEEIEDAEISLCSMKGGCGCATKSIEYEDKTHFICGKCGNTK